MRKIITLFCLVISLAACQKEQISSIKLSNNACTIEIGEIIQLHATTFPDIDYPLILSWESSNTSIIELDPTSNTTCTIYGLSTGNATVTCKVISNDIPITATCEVYVKSNASFVVESLTIEKGSQIDLNEYISNYNGSISWRTLDEYVCSINSYGHLRAHNVGKTSVLAYLYEHDIEIQCAVEVTDVKPIDISVNDINLLLDDFYTVSYTLIPNDAVANVMLSSENTDIVDVIDGMMIHAKQVGSTCLTLTTDNGVTKQITVSVNDVTGSNITDYVIASLTTPGSTIVNGYVFGSVSSTICNKSNKEITIIDCTIYSNYGSSVFAKGEFNTILSAGETMSITPVSCSNLFMPSCAWTYLFEGEIYSSSAAYDPWGGLFD